MTSRNSWRCWNECESPCPCVCSRPRAFGEPFETLQIGIIHRRAASLKSGTWATKAASELDDEEFVRRLGDLVQASPHRSLLVILHGYREAFPSALRKTSFLGHVLDINSPVLLFDWPGNQGGTLAGYRRARRVAEASGEELARTLELIIRQIQPARLWLVANSMGGQVVVDAFSDLYAEADLADAETEIEVVVLTAPDVDHEAFGQQFKQEINALVA